MPRRVIASVMLGAALATANAGVLTGQDSTGGDERVAQLIQAARELVDAYEHKSTANEHFLKLEAALDALDGTSGQTRADPDPAAPPTGV